MHRHLFILWVEEGSQIIENMSDCPFREAYRDL